jgi:hypothetical protein
VNKKSNTLNEAIEALKSTISAAYKLAPAVVILGFILTGILITISLLFVQILMGTIILLIFLTSLIVYAASKNYGEAALALLAGLLAAFTVDWTWNRYIVFIITVLSFLSFIILTSSIKLAADNESLYRDAALYIDIAHSTEIEKQLSEISKSISNNGLGPKDRADAIKMMAFRKIPIETMKYMLEAIQMLKVITGLNPKIITSYLIDWIKVLDIAPSPDYENQISKILDFYRAAPVSHEEFILAFTNTKRLVTSGKIDPASYLLYLRQGLEEGLSPQEIYSFIEEKIQRGIHP